jgi:glycerol-3-phosphate dehydrogenase
MVVSSALTASSRVEALKALADPEGLDLLVIGGGVTGAGIAVDAASRGLTTGIVEAQDWADGTSSRSSRLVHGGLRYLLRLDFSLVHEALTERDLLLATIAPHLVRPVPFFYPLKHRVWERPYVAAGVGLYDILAHAPGRRRALPIQKHYSRTSLLKAFPGLNPQLAQGAVRYFDAQVDDARLVLTLVRTAAAHGAHAVSRAQATEIIKDSRGIVTGAKVEDLLSGETITVKARDVISATGVWTEQTEALAHAPGALRVLASKGAHIVVPRDRIEGDAGLITMTEKSVLFIIPWDRYWLIGTTDTPWTLPLTHPVATADDVEYILQHANEVLARPLTRADVIGVFAGLRPLLRRQTNEGTNSAKISREHTVASPAPGLAAIAGGKLTTYRVMAKDAVDFVLGPRAKSMPCVTDRLPLLGAEGYDATVARAKRIAGRYGWDPQRLRDLLGRYGSLIWEIIDLIDADPDLGEPITGGEGYLRAEAVYAATNEGVIHLEDVMVNRTRLNHEVEDSGLAASHEIAQLIAPILGWDEARTAEEIDNYRARVEAQWAAAKAPSDAAAQALRTQVPDLTPMVREDGKPKPRRRSKASTRKKPAAKAATPRASGSPS